MATLETALDPRAPSFLENRSEALAALSRLDAAHSRALEGGGEREVTRHHARGKLLPRERIELLVDRDTALLELGATAGQDEGETPGAGLVTAVGVVEGTECMLVANDPTVRESSLSGIGRRKADRAAELARLFDLPLISLVEAVEIVSPVGRPCLAAVFGQFDQAPLADQCIALKGQGDVAQADAVADDERDALRLIRQCVRQLTPRRTSPLRRADAPCHEVDDLLAVNRLDMREVLGRLLDGSEFEEVRPHRGPAMVAGFGAIHGRRVGVLGNTSFELDPEAVTKALELVRLSAIAATPLLVLANAAEPNVELVRALAQKWQVTVLLSPAAARWALASRGFRFAWPGLGEAHDGLIDPRDTRTVLGIALSAMGGRT